MTAESERSLAPLPLPAGVRSGYIEPINWDLSFHVLTAGTPGDPLILLLHGFPELAFSWRYVLPELAAAGYYVVAPDLRGSGRTTGWDNRSFAETDLATFSTTAYLRDVLALVRTLGYAQVHCVVGHDAGGRPASLAGLARPDVFRRVVLIAFPFGGLRGLAMGDGTLLTAPSTDTAGTGAAEKGESPDPILAALAALPSPRKPYKWYYASEAAADELLQPTTGLAAFLRGYFYLKSADWPGNRIHPLYGWTATELAQMPFYYTMPLDAGMREAVQRELARTGTTPAASTAWLPDAALDVYAAEFARTGFQGALNWYRVATSPRQQRDLMLMAGRVLQPPCLNVLGTADWGAYQIPGALETMPSACARFRGTRWIAGAGHFPHQEQPAAVAAAILELCAEPSEIERLEEPRW